jgi:hypothetical protein
MSHEMVWAISKQKKNAIFVLFEEAWPICSSSGEDAQAAGTSSAIILIQVLSYEMVLNRELQQKS